MVFLLERHSLVIRSWPPYLYHGVFFPDCLYNKTIVRQIFPPKNTTAPLTNYFAIAVYGSESLRIYYLHESFWMYFVNVVGREV